MEPKRTALIICPITESRFGVERRLAGLPVGERILLALATAGIKRVAFIGSGPAPQSARADIEVFEALKEAPQDLGEKFIVLPSDLVFDRSMLGQGDEPDEDLPIRQLDKGAWSAVVSDPAGWLALLGAGRATSGKRFAIRVIDAPSARAAQSSLLLSLRKDIDGFVSSHFNRHISLFVTSWLVRTGIRPNVVTIFIVLFGLASGVAAAIAQPWWMLVVAGALFQLQSILDGCDGEIARLTYRFSKTGQWLDTLGDDFTNWTFTFGLAIGQARAMDLPLLYGVGGLVFLVQVYAALLMYQRLIRMGTGDLLALPNLVTGEPPSGNWGKVVKVLHIMSKNDTFTLITGILTAVQVPIAAFGLIACGSLGMAYGLTVNEFKIRKLEKKTGELYRN